MTNRLPKPASRMVDANGVPLPEWYDWANEVDGQSFDGTDLQAQVDALATTVAEIEQAEQQRYVGTGSVRVNNYNVRLSNDSDLPGASHYYGTDADEARGWHERLLATLADVDLTDLADGDVIAWDATAEAFVPATPSSGGVPYFIAPGATYTVPEYTQALFALPIDCEGFLDVSGYLIGVD